MARTDEDLLREEQRRVSKMTPPAAAVELAPVLGAGAAEPMSPRYDAPPANSAESRAADRARMYAIAPPMPSVTQTMTAPPVMTPPAMLADSLRMGAVTQRIQPTLDGVERDAAIFRGGPAASAAYGPLQDAYETQNRMDTLAKANAGMPTNIDPYQARQMGLTPPPPTTNQPVDPRFAGTGVGERGAGAGVIIGRSQGFGGPPAPLPSPDQQANIRRMNENYLADRRAMAEFRNRTTAGDMRTAATAMFNKAKMERNPALAAQIYREAADMLGKSAALPTTVPQTGYAGARDQIRDEKIAKEQRDISREVGVAGAQAPVVKEQVRAQGALAVADKRNEGALAVAGANARSREQIEKSRSETQKEIARVDNELKDALSKRDDVRARELQKQKLALDKEMHLENLDMRRDEMKSRNSIAAARLAKDYMNQAALAFDDADDKESLKRLAKLQESHGTTGSFDGDQWYQDMRDLFIRSAADLAAAIRSPSAPAKTGGGIPQPKTKAEYDAIPTGTMFIDTDGKQKAKK